MGKRTSDKRASCKKPAAGWRIDADGVECYEADGSTGISRNALVLNKEGKADSVSQSTTHAAGEVDTESWIGKLFLGATEIVSNKNAALGPEGDARRIQQRELRARAAAARANERKRTSTGNNVVPNLQHGVNSAPPLTNSRKAARRSGSKSSSGPGSAWGFGNMMRSMNPFRSSTASK